MRLAVWWPEDKEAGERAYCFIELIGALAKM
jgi:hypothetical protein